MLHARYGAVPPEAVIVCEMAVPTNPPAIDGELASVIDGQAMLRL